MAAVAVEPMVVCAPESVPALPVLVPQRDRIEEGDCVIVYLQHNLMHSITLRRGLTLSMKYGALRHEFIIGQMYGAKIEATAGYVRVLRHSPELWTRCMPHQTQIIYTTDIAHVLSALDVGPGTVVAEAGTGSGSLTHALARAVAPNGHVHTYDVVPTRSSTVQQHLHAHSLHQNVTCHVRDVCSEGYQPELQGAVHAVFLDLPSPWLALPHAVAVLCRRQCTRVCAFSPCIEQVARTAALMHQLGMVNVRTVELVPRTYKVVRHTASTRANSMWPEDDAQQEATQGDQSLACFTWPHQQPTHTSFMTEATLLPLPLAQCLATD